MGMAVRMGVVERVPAPQRPSSRFPPLAQVFHVTPGSVHMITMAQKAFLRPL